MIDINKIALKADYISLKCHLENIESGRTLVGYTNKNALVRYSVSSPTARNLIESYVEGAYTQLDTEDLKNIINMLEVLL